MPPIELNEKPITSPNQPNQQGEDSIVKVVVDLLQKGKAWRAKFDVNWKKQREVFDDEQHGVRADSDVSYKSNASLNIAKSTIDSILPILTDAQPGINVLPAEPADFDFAETLSKAVESWWDKMEMNNTIVEVEMDAMITDVGYIKVTWNPDAENGAGEIEAEILNPNEVFFAVEARDFNKNCPWVIHVKYMPVGELKRKHPEKADIIKPDTSSRRENDNTSTDYSTNVTLVSPTDKRSSIDNQVPASGKDERELVLVAEAWLDDHTLEEYELAKGDNEKPEKKVKKKFPGGRLVTILLEQKKLIQDVPNPYKHQKKPFVRFVDKAMPRQLIGEGEVKPLMTNQRLINSTLQNIINYMNFMGNPVWINEKGSGVKSSRITNQTGLILEVNEGKINAIKRDIPPPLPRYITEFMNLLFKMSEMISGSSDVTQGRRPTGISAGIAIESLQEAAQTRIRLKERNLQTSLSQLGRIVIALMLQYYTEPRVFKITGKRDWPEFFEFFVEETEEGTIMNKRTFEFDEENKKFMPSGFQKSAPSRGMFDVKILSGTSLPFAKAQRMNAAFKLFESGAIDKEELLNAAQWPNKEEVLQRLAKQEQAAAEAEGLVVPQTEGGI